MSLWDWIVGATLRAVPLTNDTPEGATARICGVARPFPGDEPFVPPVRSVPCVVAHIQFALLRSPNDRRTATKIERIHNRPFVIVAADVEVIVDASHLSLKIEKLVEGTTEERSVPVGARVAVTGIVMRDGAVRPDSDVSFREAKPLLKLVGNRRHPVTIRPC
jgi:hypothetical protein